jgi:hypothetical protein
MPLHACRIPSTARSQQVPHAHDSSAVVLTYFEQIPSRNTYIMVDMGTDNFSHTVHSFKKIVIDYDSGSQTCSDRNAIAFSFPEGSELVFAQRKH